MSATKKLGKIRDASFGLGGYHGAMLGLHVTLEGNGWRCCATKSAWDMSLIKHSASCNWTEQERYEQYSNIMRYLSALLAAAKVQCVQKLIGIPVEAEFENGTLKQWRVLTEVLWRASSQT